MHCAVLLSTEYLFRPSECLMLSTGVLTTQNSTVTDFVAYGLSENATYGLRTYCECTSALLAIMRSGAGVDAVKLKMYLFLID